MLFLLFVKMFTWETKPDNRILEKETVRDLRVYLDL